MKSHATGHYSRGRLPSVERTVQFANHLSVVQTAVAAAKVVFAMALLSIGSVVAPVVGALMAFAVYNANNLADVDEDAVNKPECAAFTVRWQREIAIAAGGAGLGALALAGLQGGLLAVGVVCVPVLACALYSLPIVPGTQADRLKDVLGVNTALVAAAWAIPLTYLPVALGGGAPLAHTIPVCALLFLRTFISVEMFNVRDVAGDRASGVSTLPASLGVPATQHVLVFLDGVALAVAIAAADVLPPLALVALFPVTVYSMGLTALVDRLGNVRLLCLAKDGEYLALGVLAILVI
jgi:4-hydroxybenzoate polyprenyltransferase